MNALNVENLVSDKNKPLDQLNLLTSLFHDFSSSLDLDTTLKRSTQLIQKYLHAEGISLFLLDTNVNNDDTELVCHVSSSGSDITGTRIKIDQGIIGRALREDKTQIVRDVTKDPDFFSGVDKQTGMTTRSVLCAPLSVNDHKLGVLEAINKNCDDGLFNTQDKDLLTVLANAAAIAIYNARLVEDQLDQERTRRELELARKIQRALLPKNNKHQTIFGVNIPARKLSGDFYDYFELEDGRIFFNLGDVAGKGVNAALLMAKTTSLFRCLGKTITSPAELLFIINNEINENITHGLFVTMVAGIYDPKEKRVTMANAGHQPPLFVEKEAENKEQCITAQDTASPPLGVMPDTRYEEYDVKLNNGALYIFTDGLTECWEKLQTPLGEEGVKRAITQFSSAPAASRLEDIVTHITAWKKETSDYLFDDITMLLIQGSEV